MQRAERGASPWAREVAASGRNRCRRTAEQSSPDELPTDDVKPRFLPDSERRNQDRYSGMRLEKDPYIPSPRRIEKRQEKAQEVRRPGRRRGDSADAGEPWTPARFRLLLARVGSWREGAGLAASWKRLSQTVSRAVSSSAVDHPTSAEPSTAGPPRRTGAKGRGNRAGTDAWADEAEPSLLALILRPYLYGISLPSLGEGNTI